jgi:5'-nucleotidase
MEAVLSGCPAFAISHDDFAPDDFTLAAAAATMVARAILERGLEPAQLLNVNVPAIPLEACAGIEVTRLGKRVYQDELIRREDPRGVPYYWVGGPPPTGQAIPGTDVHAVLHDRVSITPIQLDLTADRFLERLRGWELRLPG